MVGQIHANLVGLWLKKEQNKNGVNHDLELIRNWHKNSFRNL